MNNKKLEAWANRLLDTGKRNNLINFKDSKNMAVEILLPNMEDVFSKIESSYEFEVFDTKDKKDDDNDELVNENSEDNQNIDSNAATDRERYIEKYSGKLKKQSQILLYNQYSPALSVVKNIDKKSRSHIEETGVNVSYIAFGFINWKEKDDSQYTYKAPIILAPISFRNDSLILPYYIQMSEDDIVINPTFSYMMNAEYGVQLPEYKDNGINAYLSEVEQLVKDIGWTVSYQCKIGVFSFLKLNMYSDLVNNESKILANNNVRMLLGEQFESDHISIENDEYKVKNPLVDLHNVVDADSSQLDAIQMAKSGVSFVLQGPPGTGKSQTITNIIAECLSDNKKVLFVSEKMAALNVVYEKLKKADLAEFCLELHSYKANKKAFIDEICNTLRTPRTQVSPKAEAEILEKIKAQSELDDYERELHKKREVINKSLYQLYDANASCRKAKEVNFVIDSINEKDEKYLDDACMLLNQYAEYTAIIGKDYRKNYWFGYCDIDGSYQKVTEVKQQLEIVVNALAHIVASCQKIATAFAIDIRSLEDVKAWKGVFNVLKETQFITAKMFDKSLMDKAYADIIKMANLSDEVLKAKGLLDKEFEKDIYELDGSLSYKKVSRQFTSVFSRFFNSEYKALVNELIINKKVPGKLKYSDVCRIYGMLSDFQTKSEEFNNLDLQCANLFGTSYEGINTDWATYIPQVNAVKGMLDKGYSFGKLNNLQPSKYEEQKVVFEYIYKQWDESLDGTDNAIKYISDSFDKETLDVSYGDVSRAYQKLKLCLENYDLLENWIRFIAVYNKLKEHYLDEVLDLFLDQGVRTEEIVTAFKRNYYKQWIDYIIHDNDVLLHFDRIIHDKRVDSFKNKDSLQFAISKVQIKSKLSQNRPLLDMVAQGSVLQAVLREGEKKRKQKGIRKMMEEAGDLILQVKPCFLMSPLSVSTYLSSSDIEFDVVIFDEASQIFPQDAIGAIYRGKQLICVGDSKQMPPTDFFNSTIESDTSDEEEGDVNDFESILDICSATLHQLSLMWHYRSRYEQLISFSNANFYFNNLITFPSSSLDKRGIGVDYYYVENALFDRKSHTNRKEAEYIVDLVFENLKKYPERSLGVVAFSGSQQSLIDRLLTKRRQEDPSLEELFSTNQEEPFFVKNLETVQGDERDTIIFSFAYGKDSQGRILYNFGPINRQGGERRLNVAVTRAKLNVQLVASIHATDLDVTRLNKRGSQLLREYLDYAENGVGAIERAISVNPFDEFDSEFEMEVCDFLRDNGFTVDTQVGCSSFKIDLGLRRPNSSDYILAIECDGATYHSSKNARDRDRLRQEILERMGWHFYRIWSTDWFRNNSVEKKKLLDACNKALTNKNTYQSSNADQINSIQNKEDFEVVVENQHVEFPKYRRANDRNIIFSANGNIYKAIKDIAVIEAPISEEWLLKRIVPMFGKTKVTNVVRNQYESIMRMSVDNSLTRRNGFLYLTDMKSYSFRVPDGTEKRDIKYIAPEELAAGMLVFIKENVTVDRYGLYQSISKALGFTRVGEAIYEHLANSLALIGGLLDIEGDSITLKDEYRK